MENECKSDINKLTNSMNSDKRKEIAKVNSDAEDQKKKELDLNKVKLES
jgi:hypothetical protein